MKRVTALVPLMLLAGCGKVADLQPAAGKALPQKPALASTTPDSEQLLALPPQAGPQRVDELQKRGEPRKPDPFDLPPATGAPSDPQPVMTDTDDKDPSRL